MALTGADGDQGMGGESGGTAVMDGLGFASYGEASHGTAGRGRQPGHGLAQLGCASSGEESDGMAVGDRTGEVSICADRLGRASPGMAVGPRLRVARSAKARTGAAEARQSRRSPGGLRYASRRGARPSRSRGMRMDWRGVAVSASRGRAGRAPARSGSQRAERKGIARQGSARRGRRCSQGGTTMGTVTERSAWRSRLGAAGQSQSGRGAGGAALRRGAGLGEDRKAGRNLNG